MPKRKSKKKARVVQMQSKLSPKKYIKLIARNLPVIKTYVSEGILEDGLGYGVVIREKRNGEKIVGAYLLDVWCLGVKNVFYRIMNEEEVDVFLERISGQLVLEEREANYVYNLIYGAVEYAEDLGFEPHKDFNIAEYILPPVEEVDYIDIEFGSEGKPYFINGPHDNVGRVLSTLKKSVGEGNFEYILKVDEGFDGDLYEDNFEDILNSRIYKEYTDITLTISDIYEGDINQLKADFVKNTDIVVQLVLDFVGKMGNNKAIEVFEVDKNVTLACAENLIMYRDSDYLMKPEIVKVFRPDGPMKVMQEIGNVSITNFGDQKLEVLCNVLLHLNYNGKADNAEEYINVSLKSLETGQDSVFEDFYFEAYTALAALQLHVSAFGEIDFSRIELKSI